MRVKSERKIEVKMHTETFDCLNKDYITHVPLTFTFTYKKNYHFLVVEISNSLQKSKVLFVIKTTLVKCLPI